MLDFIKRGGILYENINTYIMFRQIRWMQNLVIYGYRMGNEVDFVASVITEEPYFPTKANIILIDKNAEICKNIEKDKRLSVPAMFFALVKFLKKYSKNYDAVIANQNLTAAAVQSGSRTKNFYYIQAYEPEMYEMNSLNHAVKKLIAYRTYQYPMIRIVNADIYKNYRNLKSRYVIPPGLDLTVYHPRKSRWDRRSPVKVGCIGRKEGWKGSQDVADAIEILKQRGFPVEFI